MKWDFWRSSIATFSQMVPAGLKHKKLEIKNIGLRQLILTVLWPPPCLAQHTNRFLVPCISGRKVEGKVEGPWSLPRQPKKPLKDVMLRQIKLLEAPSMQIYYFFLSGPLNILSLPTSLPDTIACLKGSSASGYTICILKMTNNRETSHAVVLVLLLLRNYKHYLVKWKTLKFFPPFSPHVGQFTGQVMKAFLSL